MILYKYIYMIWIYVLPIKQCSIFDVQWRFVLHIWVDVLKYIQSAAAFNINSFVSIWLKSNRRLISWVIRRRFLVDFGSFHWWPEPACAINVVSLFVDDAPNTMRSYFANQKFNGFVNIDAVFGRRVEPAGKVVLATKAVEFSRIGLIDWIHFIGWRSIALDLLKRPKC